jgi:hypothetical protein
MAETRTNRENEIRAKVERPTKWTPPQLLPEVIPEDGWAYRWIRTSTLGNDDAMNISSKFREGWEPVKAAEQPHMQLMHSAKHRYADSIEVGGLILCKMPMEFAKQREAHFQQQTDGQMSSVDNNFMRENNPKMPLFKERRSEVSFGRGS